MLYEVELNTGDRRPPNVIFYGNPLQNSSECSFKLGGPEGSGFYNGVFASLEAAMTDAERVLGTKFTYSLAKEERNVAFYDIELFQ